MGKCYIKAGWGYWDTTLYPLGGCFRRNGETPLEVEITRQFPLFKGCDTEGKFFDQKTLSERTICFRLSDTLPVDEPSNNK